MKSKAVYFSGNRESEFRAVEVHETSHDEVQVKTGISDAIQLLVIVHGTVAELAKQFGATKTIRSDTSIFKCCI